METDYRTKRRLFPLIPITITFFKALTKEQKSEREIFEKLL